MKRNLIISFICTILIILWVYAALSKIIDFSVFESQLKRQPLPEWSLGVFKWGLPIIELGTAFLLFSKRTRFKGLVFSTILMTLFTLYVLFALSGAFGEIPCSCAGIISALHWKGHLSFNIIFLIISALGVHFENKARNQNPEINRSLVAKHI